MKAAVVVGLAMAVLILAAANRSVHADRKGDTLATALVRPTGPVEPAADEMLPNATEDWTSALVDPRRPATATERKHADAAFRAAKLGRWSQARRDAARLSDPLTGKIVEWAMLQQAGSKPGFDAITGFIERNPNWPAMDVLHRRTEEQALSRVPDSRILQWFAQRQPATGEGMLRLAQALLAAAREDEAVTWFRRAWVAGNHQPRVEHDFFRRYGRFLRPEDHNVRLDRLLWEHRTIAARRMLPWVDAGQRALADARIALYTRRGNAIELTKRIPAELRNNGGLGYEMARWRRLRGHDDAAAAILLDPPDDLGRAERWWRERQVLARDALAQKRPDDAYRLVINHGPVAGTDFAEAQWLAGWIALRYLHDYPTAENHFRRLLDATRYPGSQARGAYWAGRAVQAAGDHTAALAAYEDAARYPTTYHGQLALLALGRDGPLPLPPEPTPAPEDIAAFQADELVRAAYLLADSNQTGYLRHFILRLQRLATTAERQALVVALGHRLGHPAIALAAARQAANAGVPLIRQRFPFVEPLMADLGVEPALLLAVARQESQFNPVAVSSEGARGLMQLMPTTARKVARQIKEPYRNDRLTRDPAYNVRLGARLLRTLTSRWDGNFLLVLAAYNAGDGRVARWIKELGDPRKAEIDVVDWVELIPIQETRHYVQQVLEGVQVYRQLLDPDESAGLELDADMRGRDGKRG